MKSILFSKTLVIGALGFFVATNTGCKQKSGCTDPLSSNYDADAESDDGSCVYPIADADGILGGIMYDKFWASEAEFTAPVDASIDMANVSGYSDFYRCKQCHGWDLMGKEGAYISRAANTGRPEVAGGILNFISTSSDQEIFDAIKNTGGALVDPARTADGTNAALGGNEHPDYGRLLTDAQIWNIAKFLKTEKLDVTELYDATTTGTYPTGSIAYSNWGTNGIAARGEVLYSNDCASCHGADGTQIDMGGLSVGQFVRTKSYEVQHKVKFGQLGSSMGAFGYSLSDMKDLYKACADPVAYPDL